MLSEVYASHGTDRHSDAGFKWFACPTEPMAVTLTFLLEFCSLSLEGAERCNTHAAQRKFDGMVLRHSVRPQCRQTLC